MILYHGSNIEVSKPDITKSRAKLDFGIGFYTTDIEEQAKKWSERFKAKGEAAIVSVYELNDDALIKCKVLKFDSYSGDWLDFIVGCREGKETTDYDIIIGGIANDKVFDTCELYLKKMITKRAALGRLKYEKPNMQLCIKNQDVIDKYLVFKESRKI
ncbi:MAG: DUF3990 domain-containing protein [Lachnospiraceae bacterium]|nr:DUF3990 domain-containing protein [Lachnospiraceae bacterium]